MPPQVILTATDLEISFGSQLVLDRAGLLIREDERIGMVGRNGSGKSTLVRILAGLMQPSAGKVTRRRELTLGYLPQESTLDDARPVLANIMDGVRHVTDLIRRYESLSTASEQAHALEARIAALDGWGLSHRVEAAMSRLNVPAADALVGRLSGGEKRRVSLCRALVGRPELLILDEPTNHLDIEAVEWIESFLAGYGGACLFITHDRYFLDRIATRIVEVADGKTYNYDGNYTDYLVAKEQRLSQAAMQEDKRQQFLRRELEWVRRGPKARTTKGKGRLDRYYAVAAQEGPERQLDVDLVIPPASRLANRVVELEQVSVAFGGRTLFRPLDFSFAPGMRIGVVGRNGVGKTSLLRVILGELKPTAGTVTVGERTRFNYIDQNRIRLDDENTVVAEVGEGREHVTLGDTRITIWSYLKRFLFTDERINTRIGQLSGGERSRVLMAKILKHGGNFLLLDEPSNDLDLSTLRMLEESLTDFSGCVVMVSHDRYFLNRMCTGILAFEADGEVRYSLGNYDDYRRQQTAASAPAEPTAAPAAPARPARDRSRPRRLTWKEKRELENIEEQILAAEAEVDRLEGIFSSPDFYKNHGPDVPQLTAQLDQARDLAAALYARWEELEVIRAAGGT